MHDRIRCDCNTTINGAIDQFGIVLPLKNARNDTLCHHALAHVVQYNRGQCMQPWHIRTIHGQGTMQIVFACIFIRGGGDRGGRGNHHEWIIDGICIFIVGLLCRSRHHRLRLFCTIMCCISASTWYT